MCFSSGGKTKTYEPAAAPAAPLPPAEEADMRKGREDENAASFGSIDGPTYRFRDGAGPVKTGKR